MYTFHFGKQKVQFSKLERESEGLYQLYDYMNFKPQNDHSLAEQNP